MTKVILYLIIRNKSLQILIEGCLNILMIYISNFYLQYEMVMQMADAFSMSKSNIVPIKEPSGGWY